MTWRLGLSTGGCLDSPILDVIADLASSGAAGVEVGTPPRHFDPLQEAQVASLADALASVALEPVSIHAPFGGLLDLADPNPHHRHAAVGAALTAGSAIARLGGRLVIVHPSDLERHGRDARARLADCAVSLRLLAANCAAEGVTVAVESPLPHLIGGHPDEFEWLLGQLDNGVRVCLDTGHTALGRHWRRFVEVAGARLAHVHVHDNRGQWDDHLTPGDGIIDWRDVARSLREVNYDGWLMLELACPSHDRSSHLQRAVQRARELFSS
ncbi:MAG TPA: sugar phosphate isomerase/epimerase family protein [Vicinamibacterales bacterium]|nr:sugar phosphate isomerase/epimerase family protein [Vicinamibacterales bacterium]